jgi:Autographiviridae endonuclease VII
MTNTRSQSADSRRESKRAWKKAWKKRNPDKVRELSRREVVRSFGITLDDYERMLKSQGGVCAVCGNPETSMFRGRVRSLAIDHDHRTNKVRGLLCRKCNTALGLLGDWFMTVYDAYEYLAKHQMVVPAWLKK